MKVLPNNILLYMRRDAHICGGNYVNFVCVQVFYDNQLDNFWWSQNYIQQNFCSAIMCDKCSPIRVGRCQDNGGAGVCIAGDPGAVDGKEHHEHHEEEDDDGTNVAVGKVAGLVGRVYRGGRGTLGALLGLEMIMLQVNFL